MEAYRYETQPNEVVLLKVYEDEEGTYYLDSGAIRALKGLSRMHDFKNEYGGINTLSDGVLRDKGAPENSRFIGSRDSDFSKDFNFNSILGLYQVTYTDLIGLIDLYEKSHPGVNVRIEIEHINKKEIEEQVAREALEEGKKYISNTNKDEYESNIDNNKKYIDRDNNLKQMLDDIKNDNNKDYENKTNMTK